MVEELTGGRCGCAAAVEGSFFMEVSPLMLISDETADDVTSPLVVTTHEAKSTHGGPGKIPGLLSNPTLGSVFWRKSLTDETETKKQDQ